MEKYSKLFEDVISYITPEMRYFYYKRTGKHIELVQKYCDKIYNFTGDKDILRKGILHDRSKYEEPEIKPYILITWDYKCKAEGISFDIPQSVRDEMNKASEIHINNNNHHPEFHSETKGEINKEDRDAVPDKLIDATGMTDLDIAEMVADWCAMSEEKENSPIAWANKNVNKKWKFSKEQTDLIYELITIIWSPVK